MFRRERPQKGRYRQFYQINAEVFGVASPLMDAQIIHMLTTLLERLKVEDARAHINSLGCPDCRPRYKEALLAHTDGAVEKLCADCNRRREKNPLRLLDCKAPACREAVSDAPSLEEFLCDDCRNHFETVKDGLDRLGVSYIIDKRLVRGLDYYSRTTFEIQTSSLGAQSAVAGGGRYDGLISALGGPETPAIGFAIGFDRLVEILAQMGGDDDRGPDLFVAPLGEKCQDAAFIWASDLSREGVITEIDFSGRSLKSLMKRANRIGARHVMIVGEAELEEKEVVVRNMATKEQVKVPVEGLVAGVKEIVNAGD
jgi:histidyl-tRNA synthetase